MKTSKHLRLLAGRVLLAALVGGGAALAAELRPEAVAGWQRYVKATEQRRSAELARAASFRVMDLTPTAAADRRAVLTGQFAPFPVADMLDRRGLFLPARFDANGVEELGLQFHCA